ncbi:17654_t:CDS:2, partial [Gigaspora rosea]
MKRIRTNKATQKVVLRKHITSNLQREDYSQSHLQSTISQVSLVPVNSRDNSSEDLQKNFSGSKDLQENFSDSEDLQENFSDSESLQEHFSDSANSENMSNSSDQSAVTEDIELQTEREKDIRQIVVDSGVDFQLLLGEYGPYFKNFTEMLLFTWVTKYSITTKAYEDLVYIIQHPSFRLEQVIRNIRRLRSLRSRLPLQKIKCHQIPIQNMNTPSISKPFKSAYTISISEHIKRVLSDRTLRSQMYFGPGIEAETKSEFWHGNIWQ